MQQDTVLYDTFSFQALAISRAQANHGDSEAMWACPSHGRLPVTERVTSEVAERFLKKIHFNVLMFKESGTYICGRIALLSRWVAQIAQMAEHWSCLPKDLGFISGLGF